MRLLVTADLHFNHRGSRPVAERLIDDMNAAGGDGVLLVGDTAVADGDSLEQCLSRFKITEPRLFVAGNHELWTEGSDSYAVFHQDLPRRVRKLGWHWLEGDPFLAGDAAVVGSVGWYDYSFAQSSLGIPRRFYQRKISPGGAARIEEFADLLERTDDIPKSARNVVARWNDGKFVKLGRSDKEFLDERLSELRRSLDAVKNCTRVIAAIHHLPFRELLPPSHSAQWDFTKAYLGSERIGKLLEEYPNVTRAYSGHSHYAREATVGHVHAVNIGSGYRSKTFLKVDL
jgi:predicted phosphodiesterase